jgi:hypothetical protein
MVLPVPMRSGASWSQAHNRLTMSPSFTDGTACRRLPILPTASYLAWLVPDLGTRSKVLGLLTLVHKSLPIYITGKNSNNSDTYKYYKMLKHKLLPTLMRLTLTNWPCTPLIWNISGKTVPQRS